MLTGTPLDLTPFGDVLKWIGNTVISLWLLATVWLAIWRANKQEVRRDKWISATKVLVVMLGIPVALISWRAVVVWKERSEFKAARDKAKALFKKRCETAGEFIYKTVPDVKGVVWMKWRPLETNHGDQFKMDDPYGSTCSGDWCIRSMLVATEGYGLLERAQTKPTLGREGYEFVEAEDPETKQKFRYTLRYVQSEHSSTNLKEELLRVPIEEYSAHYGITWDDVSTREDREQWIAGGSMHAVDLQTGTIVAKSVGYMMDPGLGSATGFRSPWTFARQNDCRVLVMPTFKREQWSETRDFAFKALQPAKRETK